MSVRSKKGTPKRKQGRSQDGRKRVSGERKPSWGVGRRAERRAMLTGGGTGGRAGGRDAGAGRGARRTRRRAEEARRRARPLPQDFPRQHAPSPVRSTRGCRGPGAQATASATQSHTKLGSVAAASKAGAPESKPPPSQTADNSDRRSLRSPSQENGILVL